MASASIREVAEGLQYQGKDEIIVYTIDVTNVGSSPTSVEVKVYDENMAHADVTTTVMPTNTPTVSANIISLSPLKLLQSFHLYRVEVKFVVGGNTLEHYFRVYGQ